jgi:hypothetical protein
MIEIVQTANDTLYSTIDNSPPQKKAWIQINYIYGRWKGEGPIETTMQGGRGCKTVYGESPVLTRQPIHYRGTAPREDVGCSCRFPAYAQTREQSTAWQHEGSTFHQTVVVVVVVVAVVVASTLKQDNPSEAKAADLPAVSAAKPVSYQWAMTTTLTTSSSRLHTETAAAKAVPILPKFPLPLRVSVWRRERGQAFLGRSMRAR